MAGVYQNMRCLAMSGSEITGLGWVLQRNAVARSLLKCLPLSTSAQRKNLHSDFEEPGMRKILRSVLSFPSATEFSAGGSIRICGKERSNWLGRSTASPQTRDRIMWDACIGRQILVFEDVAGFIVDSMRRRTRTSFQKLCPIGVFRSPVQNSPSRNLPTPPPS